MEKPQPVFSRWAGRQLIGYFGLQFLLGKSVRNAEAE
jgi:hypothetical protein